MECFNPSEASGLFTLLFGVVMLVVGALGYRWLGKNKGADLDALEAALKELDDKRRG